MATAGRAPLARRERCRCRGSRWPLAIAPELAIAVVGRLPGRDLLERIEHEVVPAAFRALALTVVAADDEPLARARQGHVEQSAILVLGLLARALARGGDRLGVGRLG